MLDGEITDLQQIRTILTTHRTIAVLGASTDRVRAGFYVPDYMFARGYEILPVNPTHVGETLWGQPFRASLLELDQPVDVVDVFRRPDQLPGHVRELIEMQPRAKVVWFQQGIRNDQVARELIKAGIGVVQNRCMLADHRRMGL